MTQVGEVPGSNVARGQNGEQKWSEELEWDK
jgi:hypothetical protein